jgi:hypothetical protein
MPLCRLLDQHKAWAHLFGTGTASKRSAAGVRQDAYAAFHAAIFHPTGGMLESPAAWMQRVTDQGKILARALDRAGPAIDRVGPLDGGWRGFVADRHPLVELARCW